MMNNKVVFSSECSVKDEQELNAKRIKLHALFASYAEFHKGTARATEVEWAVNTLRDHPTLVTEAFRGLTTFFYFLRMGARRNILEDLCALWKAETDGKSSSWWKGTFRIRPNLATDACLYGRDTDTITLILEQFPHHIVQGQIEHFDATPLGHLIGRCQIPSVVRASAAEVAQTMLTLRPECLDGHYDLVARNVVWGKVRGTNLATFLGRYCAERGHPTEFDIGERNWPMKCAVRLNLILPALSKLVVPAEADMNDDVYRFTVDSIRQFQPPLESLEFSVVPQVPYQGRQDPFILALQSCRGLRELTLSNGRGAFQRDDLFVRLVIDNILSMPGIEHLTLEAFQCTDAALLRDLVSTVVASLTSVQMRDARFLTEAAAAIRVPATSALEKIHLPWRMSSEATESIARAMKDLPFLTELTLGNEDILLGDTTGLTLGNDTICIDGLAALLELNRLRSLQLWTNSKGNLLPLAMAFNRNTSLRSFHCVANDFSESAMKEMFTAIRDINVTLREAELGCLEELSPKSIAYIEKIDYYTILNEYGRANLRVSGATVADVLQSLCAVASDPVFRRDNGLSKTGDGMRYFQCKKKKVLGMHNIQYGLLLEAPMLWASVL